MTLVKRQKNDSADITTAYYDANASEFAERTLNLNLDELYQPFLSQLHPKARILDAGCGSGRDLIAFSERGFDTTGMDASQEMVRIARKNSGRTVHHLRFQEIEWKDEFDGIWACASLLHVSKSELPDVLGNLARALKRGGILAASFKHGEGERIEDGRHFSDIDDKQLEELLDMVPQLRLLESRRSMGARPSRGVRWLHALLVCRS